LKNFWDMEEKRAEGELYMQTRRRDPRLERRSVAQEEAELVGRAKGGDAAACREIVDRFSAGLHRLAFSLVGHAQDAEDVVQETFVGAFRSLRSFEGRSSLKTWLIQILVRQAARRRQARARGQALPLDKAAPAARGPEEGLDARMDLLGALESLAPEQREVIALRELEGMTYEEMAEALGAPRGTVESRLHRARQALRERLKDYLARRGPEKEGAPRHV